jgi:catechol 2,3-dioxygenase-like lactoylglutathione lyase family enzyme
MFFGMHALIYAKDAEKARAFFRDVLQWPFVDAHEGWLIFDLPSSELGVHPIMEGDTYSHQLYLMCKDVKKTVGMLEKKGIQCAPIQEAGFGLLTSFELPGGGPFGMYQPRHPIAAGMGARAAASKKKTGKKPADKTTKPVKKSSKKPSKKAAKRRR